MVVGHVHGLHGGQGPLAEAEHGELRVGRIRIPALPGGSSVRRKGNLGQVLRDLPDAARFFCAA
ncbi:hypothetical protein ACFFX0_18480 [Citricoccus parietis]|uniref:Uncharacterized protein n=1 Tax=Citricoccus parietis TaxID=592307 RepID=A0ABV5G2C8_9MICC